MLLPLLMLLLMLLLMMILMMILMVILMMMMLMVIAKREAVWKRKEGEKVFSTDMARLQFMQRVTYATAALGKGTVLQLTREPQNPLLGAAVQLFVALRGIILFSWATQDRRPHQKSRPDCRVLLDEFAELLRLQIELHTSTRGLRKDPEKLRQCRKVFLE